jgi:site-specific DNA recombinase
MDWSRYLYYYRVSSQMQATDGHAMERYRERAIALGIPEPNLYSDIESGRSETRKGLQAVCDRLENERQLLGLVVPEHSRLHRNEKVWLRVKDILVRHRLDYIDLMKGLEPIDLTSVDGEFGVGLEALMAQRQSRMIQARVLAGHENRRAKERGQIPPFGYVRLESGVFVPRIEEYREGLSWWQAARTMVEWLLDGANYTACCRRGLEAWGQRTHHRDRPTTVRGFTNWITNPILQGHMAYFRGGRGGKEQIVRNTHEPLIQESEWAQISSRLAFAPAPRGEQHRLAKLLFCAECGHSLARKNTPRNGKNREFLYCDHARDRAGRPATCSQKKWIKYDDIEDRVIAELVKHGKEAAMLINQVTPETPERSQIAVLQTEIDQLEALNISGRDSLVAEKKRQIAALLNNENSDRPVVNLEVLAEHQAAASDPLFWEVAALGDRAILYRSLISRIEILEGAITSASFNF